MNSMTSYGEVLKLLMEFREEFRQSCAEFKLRCEGITKVSQQRYESAEDELTASAIQTQVETSSNDTEHGPNKGTLTIASPNDSQLTKVSQRVVFHGVNAKRPHKRSKFSLRGANEPLKDETDKTTSVQPTRRKPSVEPRLALASTGAFKRFVVSSNPRSPGKSVAEIVASCSKPTRRTNPKPPWILHKAPRGHARGCYQMSV